MGGLTATAGAMPKEANASPAAISQRDARAAMESGVARMEIDLDQYVVTTSSDATATKEPAA